MDAKACCRREEESNYFRFGHIAPLVYRTPGWRFMVNRSSLPNGCTPNEDALQANPEAAPAGGAALERDPARSKGRPRHLRHVRACARHGVLHNFASAEA